MYHALLLKPTSISNFRRRTQRRWRPLGGSLTQPQPTDANFRCKPRQACITSALTKAPDEERPCPKCKKTVTLQGLTPVGKGGGSSGFSSAADQSKEVTFGSFLSSHLEPLGRVTTPFCFAFFSFYAFFFRDMHRHGIVCCAAPSNQLVIQF